MKEWLGLQSHIAGQKFMGKGLAEIPDSKQWGWILEHEPTQTGAVVQGLRKTSHSLRTEPWSDSKKDRFQMASHELLLPCNNSRGPAPAWQLRGWVSPLPTWKKCPHISVFLEQKVFLKLHCKQAKKMSMWLKLLEIKWKTMRNHEEAWRSSKSEPGI